MTGEMYGRLSGNQKKFLVSKLKSLAEKDLQKQIELRERYLPRVATLQNKLADSNPFLKKSIQIYGQLKDRHLTAVI